MASSKPNLSAESLFRVDGMVAVITGGGTGIGNIMARALAANGATKIYLLGRRPDVLTTAAAAYPSIMTPLPCDVTSKPSLQAAVDKITSETGYINLLVANSGVLGPTTGRWDPDLPVSEVRRRMFEESSMEEMTECMNVNVTGAFFTLTAFLELLDNGNKNALKGGFGRPDVEGGSVPAIQSQVVVTSSVAAFSRHRVSNPPYAASKAALVQLVKAASTNMAGYGIRANLLAPGLFPSELAGSITSSFDPATTKSDDPWFIPARKFGGEEEMAGTILFLASRPGSFCNGLVLVNDGGRLAVMTSSY